MLSLCVSLCLSLPYDQPQLITTAFWRGCGEHGVFSQQLVRFYIWKRRPASQEGLMGNQSSGVKHSPAVYVQWKFPKGQLLSLSVTHRVVFFSFFLFGLLPCTWVVLFLILAWSQRFIKNSQWVEVLRKPPQQADVYLPPLGPSEHIVIELGL